MTPLDATDSSLPVPVPAPSPPPGLADVVDINAVLGARGRAQGRRPSRPAPPRSPGAGSFAVVAATGRCLFVAAGAVGGLRVVDPADPDAPTTVLGAHGAPVRALVARDGLLVSAGADGRIRGWRAGTGDDTPIAVGRHGAGVTSMALTAAGELVTAGHDGQVLSWGAGTPAAPGAPVLLGTHVGGVEALAATASNSFVTAGRDGRILCWRPGGDAPPVDLRQHRRELTTALTVIERATLVTATGQLGVVRVWNDLADGGRPEELGIHRAWVLSLVALGRDRVVAVGGDALTLWDLRSGAQARLALDPAVHVTDAAALDGGDLALCGCDGRVELVEAARLVA